MISGTLFTTFAALVSAAGQAAAPNAARSLATPDAQNRQSVAQFASCVVERHRREAAQLALSLGVNHATAQTIADAECATAPMKLWPAALQAALADVLVKEEFPTFDPTLIDGTTPLEQPVLNESAFAPKPGKTYTPEELQKLERTKADLRAGIAFWHFGECVVRANPAGAHALLMTKVASAEEGLAIQDLRPVFAQCPGLNSKFDDPADIRGTIAENFYRLAHCGHDPVNPYCDPNKPLVEPRR